jgi:protein sidekick
MEEFKDAQEKVLDVRSGDKVILNLTEIDSVPVPSVGWETRGRGPVKNGIKYHLTTKNQLVILSVDEDDHDTSFRARATNTQIGKEVMSAYTTLRVSGDSHSEIGPAIVIPLENQKAVKGKSVDFECIANARPLYEIETNWFKDGKPIDQTEIAYSLEWWNRTLVLLSVDSSYKGEYECRVQMKTGGYNVQSSKGKLLIKNQIFPLSKPFFVNFYSFTDGS